MGKTGTVTKATKKRKFVNISFDCDDATLNRLNELADLAAVTISQAVSVILAMYILDMKEIKGDAFKEVKKLVVPRSKKQLKKKMFTQEYPEMGKIKK